MKISFIKKASSAVKRLSAIATVLAIMIGATFALAQDNGNDKDQGKHKGQYKRHTNRGLHLGQRKHPRKLRTTRRRIITRQGTRTTTTTTTTTAPSVPKQK